MALSHACRVLIKPLAVVPDHYPLEHLGPVRGEELPVLLQLPHQEPEHPGQQEDRGERYRPSQGLHFEGSFQSGSSASEMQSLYVHRHDGTIWAESELDKGATFYFTLPRSSEHSEHEKNENKEPAEAECC